MNRSIINETVFNVESGQKSKIACRCKADFGGLSLFVGCKWKLVESNCPTVLFSLASDSAEFDDSFGNDTFTGDSFQEGGGEARRGLKVRKGERGRAREERRRE